jgi:hypothetical protein
MTESSHPTPGGGDPGSEGAGVLNYGVISGPVAVGMQAPVTQVNLGAGAESTMARLELALQQLTAAAARELDAPQAEEVSENAIRMAEEVHHKRPDWDHVTRLLGRITSLVGSAAGLAAAVEQVKDLVQALLH